MLRLRFKNEATQRRIETEYKQAVLKHIKDQINKIKENIKKYAKDNKEDSISELSKSFFNKKTKGFTDEFIEIQNFIRKKQNKKNVEENIINKKIVPYYALNFEESSIYEAISKFYKVVDWDDFRKNNIVLLRKIINELGVKICPYCGRNYTEVIELEDEIKIPAIDHFYPKKGKVNKNYKYEHLTLSLYNLIPSCHICNSIFKNEKMAKNDSEQILYPYKEGFGNNIVFSFALQSMSEKINFINALSGNVKQLNNNKIVLVRKKHEEIELEDSKDCKDKNDVEFEKEVFVQRCINSKNIFHIEEIYNQIYKQNAIDLVNKVVWFRKNYIRSLCEILKLVSTSHKNLNQVINSPYLQYLYNYIKNNEINGSQIERILQNDFEIIFGRWLNEENDLKEPLSKFYRDIYNQIRKPSLAYESLHVDSKNKKSKRKKTERK